MLIINNKINNKIKWLTLSSNDCFNDSQAIRYGFNSIDFSKQTRDSSNSFKLDSLSNKLHQNKDLNWYIDW